MTPPRKEKRPLLCRENILFAIGAIVLGIEVVNAEILGRTFHYEFLLLGAAFCGVGIAQFGDRK